MLYAVVLLSQCRISTNSAVDWDSTELSCNVFRLVPSHICGWTQ